MYNSKSELQCKLWTLDDNTVSMQVRQLIEDPSLVGDVARGRGEAVRMCDRGPLGIPWEIPSTPYCCESTTSLKDKIFILFFITIHPPDPSPTVTTLLSVPLSPSTPPLPPRPHPHSRHPVDFPNSLNRRVWSSHPECQMQS